VRSSRIYKYQTTYLTGSLIREMVNSVLLEHGHEEYRNKLARLGLPVYDVQDMLTNVTSVNHGTTGLLFETGQSVFAEHLLTNTLPKDVADSHLSGDLHITNPGTWSLVPDTIFVNVKELLDDGIDLSGKHLEVSRIPSIKILDDLTSSLSIIISLLSKEVSQEVVMDGLVQLLTKHTKNISELEHKLTNVFANVSTISKYNKTTTRISFRLQLGSDTKIINTILLAYKNYITITPIPQIGLIIDYEKSKFTDVSKYLQKLFLLEGMLSFPRDWFQVKEYLIVLLKILNHLQ